MKKGQVTAYIILGIVILAILGGSYYAFNQVRKAKFEKELQKASLVPPQIEPVKNFIDDCIAETAEEGISLLALQGGYIYFQEDIMPTSPNNPFSNKLTIIPNTNLKTSYWYYFTANNIETQNIPTLDSMEKELSIYINLNLPECLEGLSDFTKQGYSITKSDKIETEVNILDNIIQITIDSPMEINYKELDFKIDKHYSAIRSSLGNLYTISKQIIETETTENFLEEKTIDMLVAYEELPYSSTEFTCNTKIWTKQQVKEDLKEILATNIAAIKIKNLANTEDSYFTHNVNIKDKDVSTNFMYSKDWPIYLEIEPSEGEVLIGDDYLTKDNDMFAFLTSFFCLRNYHFIYDIKYPVLITLQQDDTLFQFAIQVVIDNNQPRQNLLGDLEAIDTEPEICKNRNTEITINSAYYASDDTLKPLPGSSVSFKCLNQICDLGETDIKGELTTLAPQCVNALITGRKDGYYKGSTFVDTVQPLQMQVNLEPIYNKKIKVKVADEFQHQIREPYSSEQIIITFKSGDYEKIITYPGVEEISLIPGQYTIESYVIGESTWPIQIQEQTIETCVETPRTNILGIFGAKEEECITTKVPAYELEQIIKGGAVFEYLFDRYDLATSKELTIYTVVNTLPTTNEQVMKVYDQIETNSQSSLFKYPELK